MILARITCEAKTRVGMNGNVAVRFEAVPGTVENRKWSEGPNPKLDLDVVLTRDVARKLDVGETYVMELRPAE